MEFINTTRDFIFCLFLEKSGVAWENFEMGLDLGFGLERGSKLWGDMEGTDAMAIWTDTELGETQLSFTDNVFLSELKQSERVLVL